MTSKQLEQFIEKLEDIERNIRSLESQAKLSGFDELMSTFYSKEEIEKQHNKKIAIRKRYERIAKEYIKRKAKELTT